VCVRACVRACMRACVRACVCEREREREREKSLFIKRSGTQSPQAFQQIQNSTKNIILTNSYR